MCVYAGTTLLIRRITPFFIFLSPPEELVIEVESVGGYVFSEWSRNRISHGLPQFRLPPESFVNFGQILHRKTTNSQDLSVYSLSLVPGEGQKRSNTISFLVMEPGNQHVDIDQWLDAVGSRPPSNFNSADHMKCCHKVLYLFCT